MSGKSITAFGFVLAAIKARGLMVGGAGIGNRPEPGGWRRLWRDLQLVQTGAG
jgi:hypothetical protein